jgi:hypothetical protein
MSARANERASERGDVETDTSGQKKEKHQHRRTATPIPAAAAAAASVISSTGRLEAYFFFG